MNQCIEWRRVDKCKTYFKFKKTITWRIEYLVTAFVINLSFLFPLLLLLFPCYLTAIGVWLQIQRNTWISHSPALLGASQMSWISNWSLQKAVETKISGCCKFLCSLFLYCPCCSFISRNSLSTIKKIKENQHQTGPSSAKSLEWSFILCSCVVYSTRRQGIAKILF